MHLSFKNQNISSLKLQSNPQLKKIQSLDLSHNKIGVLPVDCFSIFGSLTHLDLSHNNIQELCHEWPQTLQYLDLSCNRITKLTGLESCCQLDTLLVRHNQLDSLKGIAGVMSRRLRVLDASENAITTIDFNPKYVTALQSLNLSKNNIQMLEDVRVLSRMRLKELWLVQNPIAIKTVAYRNVIINLVPGLEQLDGSNVDLKSIQNQDEPSMASYRLHFEKMRNRRKEAALNVSLSGGVSQNFSILQNDSDDEDNNTLVLGSKALGSPTKAVSPAKHSSPLTSPSSVRRRHTPQRMKSPQRPTSRKKRQVTDNKSLDQDASQSFDHRVSITELHDLRSENEQLRAMIQNLRQSLSMEKQLVKKRTAEKGRLQRVITNQERIVAQERLATKTVKSELKQIKKEMQKLKKSENSLRVQYQNLAAASSGYSSSRRLNRSINSKQLDETNMSKSTTRDTTEGELHETIRKKDEQIRILKEKLKRRNEETKKDMNQLMSYVTELQSENVKLSQMNDATRNTAHSIQTPSESRALTDYNLTSLSSLAEDMPTILPTKQDNPVTSPSHSISIEEAERIADDIIQREFSSGAALSEYTKHGGKKAAISNRSNASSKPVLFKKTPNETQTSEEKKSNLDHTSTTTNHLQLSSIQQESNNEKRTSSSSGISTDDGFMSRVNSLLNDYQYETLSPMMKNKSERPESRFLPRTERKEKRTELQQDSDQTPRSSRDNGGSPESEDIIFDASTDLVAFGHDGGK